MCLRFVCKQSDENHSVHGCPFLAGIFQHFFLVCDDCILKSTTAWLLKLSVLYIHSFMQVHNTTFQIKTVFNNVLFSTEVHNPLHAQLLALSHIYIVIYIDIWVAVQSCVPLPEMTSATKNQNGLHCLPTSLNSLWAKPMGLQNGLNGVTFKYKGTGMITITTVKKQHREAWRYLYFTKYNPPHFHKFACIKCGYEWALQTKSLLTASSKHKDDWGLSNGLLVHMV